MTLFWIISAAMMMAAIALLAPTLLRQRKAPIDGTEKLNIAIAREHLAELVKQRDLGELSDEEFAQARQDLELALAQDLEGSQTPAPKPREGGGSAGLILAALLIPLIAVPAYLQIGSPQLIKTPPGSLAAQHAATGELPPIEQLVVQLRERMEASPENAEGWFLLGRTYMRLQDYPQAVYAFEKVAALLPDEPAGLLALADALTMSEGRRVGPRAVELLEQALRIDPASVTALWLLGNAASASGDNAAAMDYWQRAYPLLDDEPEMQTELGRMIQQAGGTTAPAMAPPETVAVEHSGTRILVEVAVATPLLDGLTPSDTVFVLARAEDGPPMPLAVSRHSVDELPLEVTLSDAMAMMPGMQLSSFPRVKVSARVSRSGQAGLESGDMLADDVVVDTSGVASSRAQLLINRVAP